MKSLCLCITGTDTDAGKTVVTAALARAAIARGQQVLVIKPVQTGAVPVADGTIIAPDMAVYNTVAPEAKTHATVLFAPACSPHLAAREAGKKLNARNLADAVLHTKNQWEMKGDCSPAAGAARPCNLVLLEGAGGLLTPLSDTETLRDFFVQLRWPMLLVAANRLGGVNHTLLSLENLRAAGLDCLGFVLAETTFSADPTERNVRRDNRSIITSLSNKPCLAELPFLSGLHEDDTAREAAWNTAARALMPVLDALEQRSLPEHAASAGGTSAAFLEYDRAHIWHPYTSAIAPIHSWEAASTTGTRIRLKDGRELVDGMSSWWCAIHGYCHPKLMEALEKQARQMPHVMFGGLTHEPAVGLAQKLLGIVPAGLEHVFFADSGSVSVEVAIKMALQYWQAAGNTAKNRLLTVRGGYHGDTMGAMSVCDPENGMHGLFAGYLPQQLFAPRPACRFDAPYDPGSAQALKALLQQHGDTVAAVILEPIVQGAGGMWLYHPDYLRAVRSFCDTYGCLLILDEIATGFGRTGKLFACEHAGVTPDIMCLGKGLTGGVMTLAATLTTSTVAKGISQDGGVLMHGPTFMANPLACSVAGASLDLLALGDWKTSVGRIEKDLKRGLAECTALPGVADVRILGAIGVVEMEHPVHMERLQAFFVDKGVWIRPFGKLIYLMPPYITTSTDIALLCTAIRDAVRQQAWT